MTATKSTTFWCDAPSGCSATAHATDVQNVRATRAEVAAQGWKHDRRTGLDYCPKHKP